MAHHHLEPTRENLRGRFSREHAPVLTVQPGDTVTYRTLDAGWGLEQVKWMQERLMFEPRTSPDDDGHAMIGPIAIAGAKAGMTLEVKIGDIRPGSYGFTFAGGWDCAVNQRLGLVGEGSGVLHQWTLDAEAMTGTNQHGHTVTLHPFMGVMGMPPNEPGMHSTTPPRFCGGNIDCKALVSGSTLYLPIPVDGGLFYVGDGHAAQGDGESSVTAIECPIERVDLTFNVRDDVKLSAPRANTPDGWVTFGFHEDLNEATYLALEGMLTLMGELLGVGRADALALASVAVDLRITQIVNTVRGVHAILPHGAIR
ncbi:MAG: acetamidase/formamidase family protein [Anaerolineae bacterium]